MCAYRWQLDSFPILTGQTIMLLPWISFEESNLPGELVAWSKSRTWMSFGILWIVVGTRLIIFALACVRCSRCWKRWIQSDDLLPRSAHRSCSTLSRVPLDSPLLDALSAVFVLILFVSYSQVFQTCVSFTFIFFPFLSHPSCTSQQINCSDCRLSESASARTGNI